MSRTSLTVVCCPLVNPDTFIAHEAQEGEEKHNCAIYTPDGQSQAEDRPSQTVRLCSWTGPLQYNRKTRVRHTGAAVMAARSHVPTERLQITAQQTLLPHLSTQEAELIALIEVLTQSTGRTVTIYSDSAYVTTTVHSTIAKTSESLV